MTVIPIIVKALKTILWKLKIWERTESPDHSTAEISENTWKSPGNLGETYCHSNISENNQFLLVWKNRSPSPEQRTRPSISLQEEKKLSVNWVWCSNEPLSKNERKQKDQQKLEFYQRAEKQEHESNKIGALGMTSKAWKRDWGPGDERKNWDHSDHSSVQIS